MVSAFLHAKNKAERRGAKNYIKEHKSVIDFENGSYLCEIDEFVPLANGKIQYKPIKVYKGFSIRFQKNGTEYFSVWKNDICLESNIGSIKDSESIINEFKNE